MSYNQIFRRLSRLFQSTVNSVLDDLNKEEEQAFDEELRKAEQEAKGDTGSQQQSTGNQQSKRKEQRQQNTSQGKRKPGERDNDYYLAVLGLTSSATNDEVKRAYRKLMAQYHPDKVATLAPELQKIASEKSKAINEAYMIIERRRGMK